MKILELLSKLNMHVEVIAALLPKLELIYDQARVFLKRPRQQEVSYKNTFLEMIVDIEDEAGRRAMLKRRLGVRFLRPELGLIRELAWGDGKPVARYTASGARRLSTTREGPRSVMLLGLEHRPQRGEQAVVTSSRLLLGAFQDRLEYFEALVERPTRDLSVKVVFPATRPPREGHVVASPPGRTIEKLPVHYGREGRPFIVWHDAKPTPFTNYSLRWAW